MPHALITGGAGFIGSHLSDYLLKHDYNVTVIDNLSTGSVDNIKHLETHPNFRFVMEDIRNINTTDRWVSECDIIFHMAAVVGVHKIIEEPINTIETNIGGTEVLLKAARRYRKKIMVASTSEVYGKGVSFPFKEDDDSLLGATSKSRWSYATSKAIDEFLAFAYHYEADLPVVLFRLFNTIGARQSGQYGMVVPRFVQWALKNEPIQVYGDGGQSRSFGNVNDIVDAIHRLSLSEEAVGELFNIGNNQEITILELAQLIKERTDSRSEIQLIPYEKAYTAPGFEDFRRRVPSIDKIEAVVGWQPTTNLSDTIDQIIDYYREKM